MHVVFVEETTRHAPVVMAYHTVGRWWTFATSVEGTTPSALGVMASHIQVRRRINAAYVPGKD